MHKPWITTGLDGEFIDWKLQSSTRKDGTLYQVFVAPSKFGCTYHLTTINNDSLNAQHCRMLHTARIA